MDALGLANYIVDYCIKLSNPISNLQLQKILYFCQVQSIKETGHMIMPEAVFEAWRFGPVIPEVYYKYFLNAGLPIEKVEFDENFSTPSDVPKYIKDLINKLLNLDPWRLVAISHRNGGAWAQTYIEGRKLIIKSELIHEDAKVFNVLEL